MILLISHYFSSNLKQKIVDLLLSMEDFDILINLCSRLDINIERVLNQTNTIFQDKLLISLDLSHMKIIHLPDSIFSKLQYLEDLDLSNNKIRIINDKVFENCFTISRLLIQENKSLIINSLETWLF